MFLSLYNVLTESWFLLLVTVVVLSAVHYYASLPRGLPPGPFPLPWIGSFPYLLLTGKDLPLALSEFGQRYGSVFTLYYGRTPAIVLHNADAIRYAFIKKGVASHGRPHMMFWKYITGGKGFTATEGPIWKNRRRITTSTFQHLGLGTSCMEHTVYEEARTLVNEIEKLKGLEFNPKNYFPHCVANVVSSVVLGRRYKRTDARFSEMVNNFYHLTHPKPSIYLVEVCPWLEHVPGNLFNLVTMQNRLDKVYSFISDTIKDHLNQEIDPDNPRDLTEAYLMHTELEGGTKLPSGQAWFNEEQVVSTVIELFSAGIDSTSTTMAWGFLYLAMNPDVQQRAADEVLNMLGKDGMPSFDDKQKMPYVEACLLEMQRIGNVAPCINHAAYETFTMEGYTIPKGAWILPNFWFVHRDPAHWPDPERFDPDRHLDQDGNVVQQYSFLPFSIGPRMCAGEFIARVELFFFVTTLLQKFRFRLPTGSKPSLEGIMGVTHTPHPYQLIAELRE